MRDYTAFLIRVESKEILFCHEVRSVPEFWMLEDEIIYDYFGLQGVKRSEISHVRLCLGPFGIAHFHKFGRAVGGESNLFAWVVTLSEEEQEDILNTYEHTGKRWV